jgi:Pentapeptide repeats (8 copies)
MAEVRIATFNLENFDETAPDEWPLLAERIQLMRPQVVRCGQTSPPFRSGQERPNQPRSLLAPADLLTGTNLAGAELASTRTANFRGAKVTGADLTFAELRGADFTRADLRNAVLTDVCFDHTTQWGLQHTANKFLLLTGLGHRLKLDRLPAYRTMGQQTDFRPV